MKQLDISCVSCIFSGYDENNTKKAIHFSTRSFNTTPFISSASREDDGNF